MLSKTFLMVGILMGSFAPPAALAQNGRAWVDPPADATAAPALASPPQPLEGAAATAAPVDLPQASVADLPQRGDLSSPVTTTWGDKVPEAAVGDIRSAEMTPSEGVVPLPVPVPTPLPTPSSVPSSVPLAEPSPVTVISSAPEPAAGEAASSDTKSAEMKPELDVVPLPATPPAPEPVVGDAMPVDPTQGGGVATAPPPKSWTESPNPVTEEARSPDVEPAEDAAGRGPDSGVARAPEAQPEESGRTAASGSLGQMPAASAATEDGSAPVRTGAREQAAPTTPVQQASRLRPESRTKEKTARSATRQEVRRRASRARPALIGIAKVFGPPRKDAHIIYTNSLR